MTQATLTAPQFILSLVDSAPNVELRAAVLTQAAGALGIDARNIRVALARLSKQGVLRSVGRGAYRVGDRGEAMLGTVLGWAEVESALKPWDGQWLGVHHGHLTRQSKTALRARDRALRLKGFRAAGPGWSVRPANLRASAATVHAQLVDLGMAADAYVLVSSEIAPNVDLTGLWDRRALERGYQGHLEALARSTDQLPRLSTSAAASETLLIGRAVTRSIVLDPLLPRELVDVALRSELIAAMGRYDRLGKACWRAFYAEMD